MPFLKFIILNFIFQVQVRTLDEKGKVENQLTMFSPPKA